MSPARSDRGSVAEAAPNGEPPDPSQVEQEEHPDSFDPGVETGYLRRGPRDHSLDVEVGAAPFDPGPERYDTRRARRIARRREKAERKRQERAERLERAAEEREQKDRERREREAREAEERERREREEAAARERRKREEHERSERERVEREESLREQRRHREREDRERAARARAERLRLQEEQRRARRLAAQAAEDRRLRAEELERERAAKEAAELRAREEAEKREREARERERLEREREERERAKEERAREQARRAAPEKEKRTGAARKRRPTGAPSTGAARKRPASAAARKSVAKRRRTTPKPAARLKRIGRAGRRGPRPTLGRPAPLSLRQPTVKAALALGAVTAVALGMGALLGLPLPGLGSSGQSTASLTGGPAFALDGGTPTGLTKGPYHPVVSDSPLDYGESAAKFHADRGGRKHEGQDVFAKPGTPLVAVRDGIVLDGGGGINFYSSGGGNTLVIYSPLDDRSYVYLHMLKPALVKAGDKVRAGQPVGQVGCTGSCYGPHLHFEVRLGRADFGADAKAIDPGPVMRRWQQVPAP